jgi:integrase
VGHTSLQRSHLCNLAKSGHGERRSMSRRGGQSGTVVKKGNWWHGRYYIDVAGSTTRARKSVAIGRCDEMTKPEARRKLAVMLHELGVNDNSYLDKALTPVKLFSEQAEWWEANVLPMHKQSSQNSSHYILKKHLIPYFGQMPMDAISESTVQEWISGLKLQGTLGPKTIANMWKVLKLIIGKPTREWTIRLPEIPETEQRYFTPKETQQLIDAAEGQYKALFALQFATGMRFGEMAGLHVEDLDFSELIVYIRRSTFIHQEVSPKSKAGYREVDVDPGTMAIVKEYLGDRKSGRVFESRNGTPLVNGNVNRFVLKPLCKKIGIPVGTTHAFRHGRVSVLQQGGVSGDLIKRWVGHSSLKTTSKYSHFTREFRKEIAAKLG